MSIDYQKVYEGLNEVLTTNLDKIDINGNVSVAEIDNIIGYCRISNLYYLEDIAKKLEKRLLKKGYLPGRFGGFEYDYKTNKMKLILEYSLGEKEEYVFERLDNNDIILIDSTYKDKGQKLLPMIGDILHDLANHKIKMKEYEEMNVKGIKSIDNKFVISLIGDEIRILTEGAKIKLSYDEFNCDKQDLYCDSYEISKLLKTNLDKFLKKIRINISDCPKWMQEELKHINNKEIKKREDKNKIKKIFKR